MTQNADVILGHDITVTLPALSIRPDIGAVGSGKVEERWKLWKNHVDVIMKK